MKTQRNTTIQTAAKAARKAARDQEIRTGIRGRATTFADKKKVANRNACRGKFAA